MAKTIDQMVRAARSALGTLSTFNREQVDKITEAMCQAKVAVSTRLAEFPFAPLADIDSCVAQLIVEEAGIWRHNRGR